MADDGHPLLIKSATDGQRLRSQIRREREDARRQHAELIARIRKTLSEADTVLGRILVPPPRK